MQRTGQDSMAYAAMTWPVRRICICTFTKYQLFNRLILQERYGDVDRLALRQILSYTQ